MGGTSVRRGGFIGTGIMGGPMLSHLARAGFDMTAWNRTPSKIEDLAVAGIRTAAVASDVAKGAGFVVSMLNSGPVSDAILMGDQGVIAAMEPGSCLIVMSSIPVETARWHAEACVARGVMYLDAPVSGGEKGARDASLAIMAGGTCETFDASLHVLSHLGRPVHVGPSGSGMLTKLANQVIVASTLCAVAEALLLVEAGGGDLAKAREVWLSGFAQSTILREHGLRMIEGHFNPGGTALNQVKDTSTALAFADSQGLVLPLAAQVDRLFRSMIGHGDGELDHSGIIREVRRMSDVIIAGAGEASS